MKLRPKQIEALKWLSEQPWEAAWWGGRPHCGWPKQMPAQTYNSLSLAHLVRSVRGDKWSETIVSITPAGRAALASLEQPNKRTVLVFPGDPDLELK